MNQEVKKLWVDALRSGKYVQGSRYLRSADEMYCCLGVLCDIAQTHGVIEPPLKSDRAYRYDGYVAYIPPVVCDWAGMTDAVGDRVTIGEENVPLSVHNDKGRTFAEIAAAIESQL